MKTPKVKCPRCGRKHTWPTEDKLCRRCEKEWVESGEMEAALQAGETHGEVSDLR